ncbi:MAG TPA: prepilin-type N-terminal cleavage/methylation domain-containing protein [Thermoanaerobaculia bacterium]|jgi:prepilin-type N-terminal cleavage/methylation domain-containing protein
MRTQKRQRGFTLTEVLVATAIFTIVMLAALLMYDRNNRVFKSGVQASDVQQNTRIGFDKLVSDLRIEGFDYNRNGDPSGASDSGVNYQRQPDEQIEYMGDGAIVFRANFNYNTGYDNGREGSGRNPSDLTDTYEADAFPVVTTANNEIVTYALKSNSGNVNANKSTIDFYADVAKPRTAYHGGSGTDKERHVVISGYDTTNNYPPYTLYRITLKDADIPDSAADPVGNAVPIATNVRSLKFSYYSDQSGSTTALTPIYGAGQYDASNAQAVINERSVRSSIQSVRVELIGMESAADANYSSPLETTATDTTGASTPKDANGVPVSQYRQYQLTSLIVPRNVGKRAVKEELLLQPESPILKTACYGACSVPYFTWQAPKDGNVDFYAIIYDVDTNNDGCASCTFSNGYPVGNVTEAYFPRPLNPGTVYYFRIEASNGYGDAQTAETVHLKATNTTTPNHPTFGSGQGATTNLTNRIRLTWQTPVLYTGSPTLTCIDSTGASAGANPVAQSGIAPAENIAYRVYRVQGAANKSFDPDSGTADLIASETNGVQPYVDINGVATLDDYVPACTDFYYRIQAVASDCVNNATENEPAQVSVAKSAYLPDVSSDAQHGIAAAAAPPKAPTNFAVTRQATGADYCPPAGTLRGASVNCSLYLTFDKVTQDTSTPAQPVKIDNYILTRTQIQPTSATPVTINIPGQWDSTDPLNGASYGGNTVTYKDYVPMTDAAGRSYQYTYSLVASTNSCSATSSPVTVTEPAGYYTSIVTDPVTVNVANAGNGSAAQPWDLYSANSVITFKANNLSYLDIYITGNGKLIDHVSGSASPYAWPIDPGLVSGIIYTADFVARDTSGNYYTETVFFTINGGVCTYNGPNAVSSATQTNNGTALATPWSLKPGQTISWSASDLASTSLVVADASTGGTITTASLTGTSETFTWPTLTYGKTYQITATLADVNGCNRQETYYVTQICNAYGGGTPAFVQGDATHTGTSSANAWQILTGGTIKVTESSMKTLKVTVTDVTSSTAFATASYTASAGVVTITWPATNVTTTPNHIYQIDMALVDANGCTSSTYTRYVTQYCTYSGSTPTFANTQTLRKTTDTSGTGATTLSPFLMVPNIDMITVTENSVKTVYVDYLDTSGNALSGVTTQTWTGSSPIKFSNPYISGKNNQTYRIDITLADSNGCKTTTKYTYYVTQVPCVLRPQSSAADTAIISNLFNPSGPTGNKANTITIYNRTSQLITVNSVLLEFGSLGSGNTISKVVFSTGTVTLNSGTSPLTATAPGGTTIAANSSITFEVDYSYKPSSTPLTGVCVTYTTSVNTPSTTVTQSCNINYSASASVSNPNGCD